MQRRNLTFRVFVSSTFSDLKAERNAQQQNAFPRLRAYCQEKGARFQAIDNSMKDGLCITVICLYEKDELRIAV